MVSFEVMQPFGYVFVTNWRCCDGLHVIFGNILVRYGRSTGRVRHSSPIRVAMFCGVDGRVVLDGRAAFLFMFQIQCMSSPFLGITTFLVCNVSKPVEQDCLYHRVQSCEHVWIGDGLEYLPSQTVISMIYIHGWERDHRPSERRRESSVCEWNVTPKVVHRWWQYASFSLEWLPR